jgi:2'-5' RNA ligase
VTLAGAVARVTTELGHQPEARAYHPHVTVARAARPCSLTGLVDELGAAGPGPAWTVADVALVASDTRPEGAVHTEWARRPLSGA